MQERKQSAHPTAPRLNRVTTGEIKIIALNGLTPNDSNDLLEQAYRLRHRVFVDAMNWKALRKADGREIDQFDTADAMHVLATEGGRVVGYSRLLPTVKANLLSTIYPHLAAKPIPKSPSTWEWTRYCVAPEKRGQTAIGNVGSVLLYSAMQIAHNEGIISLSMQTDPIWITRFFDLGFSVAPLGLPIDIEGAPVVALTIDLTETSLRKCRRMLRLKTIDIEHGSNLVRSNSHDTPGTHPSAASPDHASGMRKSVLAVAQVVAIA